MLNHKNKNNRNQLYLIPCGSLLYIHDYPSPIGGRGGEEKERRGVKREREREDRRERGEGKSEREEREREREKEGEGEGERGGGEERGRGREEERGEIFKPVSV